MEGATYLENERLGLLPFDLAKWDLLLTNGNTPKHIRPK